MIWKLSIPFPPFRHKKIDKFCNISDSLDRILSLEFHIILTLGNRNINTDSTLCIYSQHETLHLYFCDHLSFQSTSFTFDSCIGPNLRISNEVIENFYPWIVMRKVIVEFRCNFSHEWKSRSGYCCWRFVIIRAMITSIYKFQNYYQENHDAHCDSRHSTWLHSTVHSTNKFQSPFWTCSAPIWSVRRQDEVPSIPM